MALIQKIRNQSALLIGVIGVSMILFILGGDFMTSRGGLGTNEVNVAVINGEEISFAQFEQMVNDQIIKSYGDQPVNESIRQSIRQRIWSMLVNDKIMFNEYESIGLAVTPDEIFDQIKNTNANQVLMQFFTNPQTGRVYDQLLDPMTGGLSTSAVLNTVKQMVNSPEGEENWLQIEEAIKLDRYSAKYANLIKKGLNATSLEAETDYFDKNRRVSFSYVKKEYTEIADDAVQISDSDLKKYYDAHKHEANYKQKDPTRAIEYVIFEVFPSVNDIEEYKNSLEDIKIAFTQETNDTAFVNENADTPLNIQYYVEGYFEKSIDSALFNGANGTVVGPFIDRDYYKLAKLVGTKMVPDSVNARHILIRINEGDTAKAQAKADSLMKVIRAKKNFDKMAEEFSEDFGSAQDGGNLNWFAEGAMVKPFNDACFNGKKGDMVSVISQFGIHIIEILNQSELKKKALIAVVDRKLEPGRKTFDEAYNKASAFSINNNTPVAFRKEGNEIGIRLADQIKEGDKSIAGIESSRDLIRWVFNAKVGNVSSVFEFDNKFVIAHLTEVREKGILPLDNPSIQDRVKQEVLIEKKAEIIKAEMSGAIDLNSLAQKLNKEVTKAENVSFSAMTIPGIGGERKLIGQVFSLPKGQISQPISDRRAVYVVVVEDIIEPQPMNNYFTTQLQMSRNMANRVDYEVYPSIEEASSIEDNRAKFY
jgi:peptidyl-prolyl cis-trans isomerase D